MERWAAGRWEPETALAELELAQLSVERARRAMAILRIAVMAAGSDDCRYTPPEQRAAELSA